MYDAIYRSLGVFRLNNKLDMFASQSSNQRELLGNAWLAQWGQFPWICAFLPLKILPLFVLLEMGARCSLDEAQVLQYQIYSHLFPCAPSYLGGLFFDAMVSLLGGRNVGSPNLDWIHS